MRRGIGLAIGSAVLLMFAFAGTNTAEAQGYYYRAPACPAYHYYDPNWDECVPMRPRRYYYSPPTREERVIGGVLGIIQGIQEYEWCRKSGRC